MVAKTFVSKKAPVEPEWHKKLQPLAKLAGQSGTFIGSPQAVAFKNMCRHLVATRILVSWELITDQQTGQSIYWAVWTARDPLWSGRV